MSLLQNLFRSSFLAATALVATGAAWITPAQAGVSAKPSPRTLPIQLPSEPSMWEEKFLPQTPTLPLTNGVQLASRVLSVSRGQASWYGPGFFGNRTASGEILRPGTLTAAHRTLPFGTRVRVTNLRNGRATVVRINDRGPFHGNRIIDLAHGAAQQLGLTASGISEVRLEVLN
jgi:rare lipoprotein A